MSRPIVLDQVKNTIKIGDRVKILCDEDKSFFRRLGVVILIDRHENRQHCSIFVQMVTGGGGIWWQEKYVRIQPKLKPRKRAKRSTKVKIRK